MVLKNKHALVTGGGTGVGAAIALRLANDGAKVTITGRRADVLESFAKSHENIAFVVCDVTDESSVKTAFDEAKQNFGMVDFVIANAGAANSKPFNKLSADDLQFMLDVNLKGVFHCFQAGLTDMKQAGAGRLIAVASTAGLKGYGYVSHYCAAKFGVVGMVQALAIELGKTGITANCVCPSYVDTPMTARTIENIMAQTGLDEAGALKALVKDNPQGRLIKPEEVADSVAWLCNAGALAINGQAISISGGEV